MTLPYAEIARHNIGSPTMSTNHDIFDTFIAAKQALDELPATKALLNDTLEQLDHTKKLIEEDTHYQQMQDEEIVRLKKALADKEEALTSATFLARDYSRKLDTLRGILGGSDPVSDQLLTVPLGGQHMAIVTKPYTASTDAPASGVETPTPSIDPFQPSDSVVAKTDGVESDKGQSEAGPTGMSENGSNKQADSLSADGESSLISNESLSENVIHSDPAPEVAVEVGESLDNHVSSTISGSSADDQNAGTITDAGHSCDTPEANAKPYTAQPYWNKPDLMDWSRWTTLGGDPAPWMKEVPTYTD